MYKNQVFHVIICIHPMLNIYITELLNTINSTNYIIIEMYSSEVLTEQTNLKRYRNKNKLQLFLNLFRIKNKLNKLRKKYDNIHYYIPHPIHIISNYIAFSILRQNDCISLIADGVMNYYSCKSQRFKNKMKFFKIISYLLNINYKLFNDHCTAYNVISYKYLFVIYKEGVVSIKSNMQLIELKTQNSKVTTLDNILIVGQPSLDDDAKNKLLISQINIIEKNNKIYYKPHPSEIISSSTKRILDNHNISILSSNKPIESINNTFDTYISTTSSVLINMKILYPKVKCIAVMNNYQLLIKMQKNICAANLDELKATFQKIGVFVYDKK